MDLYDRLIHQIYAESGGTIESDEEARQRLETMSRWDLINMIDYTIEPPKLIFKKLHRSAKLPFYASAGAAGMDVCYCAAVDPMSIRTAVGQKMHRGVLSGGWEMIPTGLAVEIPDGYELQVRPRSGLAAGLGVTVLNSPGTIDSDYRGEIKVILINHGEGHFNVMDGDRIAQLVLAPVARASIVEGELSDTERGEGGFGSTG